MKYLGVLINSNLSWRYLTTLVIYLIESYRKRWAEFARLDICPHFNSPENLLFNYCLYLLYLPGARLPNRLIKDKIFILQTHALHLMYFSDSRVHAISLFFSSEILVLNLIYTLYFFYFMHVISNYRWVPPNIPELFIHPNQIHSYCTRSLTAGQFYAQRPTLNQKAVLLL